MKNQTPNREYRAAAQFLPESEQQGEALILRGTPVVFETPTCLFEHDGVKYYEVIDSRAFEGCDFSDFIFNYNHGGRVYARNRNGTLEHSITATAMECVCKLMADDEGHRQLYRDVQSGLIDKMSFSFTVSEENYNKDVRTRRILRIKKLYDVSAVDFPAYNDTSISARSASQIGEAREVYRAAFAALDFERRKQLLKIQTYL